MRQAKDYAPVKDEGLDIIYGQHVSRTICNLPQMGNGPDCSLHGKQVGHFAPDDWGRPQPIGAGGMDYDAALEAAREFFGGIQIDIVLTTNSRHHVYVTRASKPEDGTGIDPTRADDGQWLHAVERDRWVSVRRSVIRCILALADAPLEATVLTPTSVVAG